MYRIGQSISRDKYGRITSSETFLGTAPAFGSTSGLICSQVLTGFFCLWLVLGSFCSQWVVSYPAWSSFAQTDNSAQTSAASTIPVDTLTSNVNSLSQSDQSENQVSTHETLSSKQGESLPVLKNSETAAVKSVAEISVKGNEHPADSPFALVKALQMGGDLSASSLGSAAPTEISLPASKRSPHSIVALSGPTSPDLDISVGDFTISNSAPSAGTALVVSLVVHNIGTATATGWYATYTDTQDANGTVDYTVSTAGNITLNDISSNGQNTQITNQTIPQAVAHPGSHSICATVSVTDDNNPANNRICKTVIVTDGTTPSYQLSVTTQSLNTWTNNSSTLVASIKNTGTSTVRLSGFSAQPTGSNGLNIVAPPASTLPAQLAPGEQTQLSFTVNAPSSISGSSATDGIKISLTSPDLSVPDNTTSVQITSQPPSYLQVTVVKAGSSQRFANATVMVDDSPTPYQTDQNGTVTIPLTPGIHNVYSINDGFIPGGDTIVIQPLGTAGADSNSMRIELVAGNYLDLGSIDTTPLTGAQAAALGVDVNDPSNQQIYQFTLNLLVQGVPTPVVVPVAYWSANPTPGSSYDIPPAPVTIGGPGGTPGTVRGTVYYPTNGGRVDSWIIIPGDVRFLKQFWEATMFVKNSAPGNSGIVLQNVHVTLNTPGGLSLPNLNGAPQAADKLVSTLSPGAGQTLKWVVRGDAAGTYKLTATGTGSMQINNGPTLALGSVTAQSGNLTVYTPKLKTEFKFPSYVQTGSEVSLQIKVTNTSPVPLYKAGVTLYANRLHNIHLTDPTQNYKALSDPLVPGATSSVTFKLIPELTGCVALPPTSHVSDYDPAQIDPDLELVPTGYCPGTDGHNQGDCPCPQGDPVNPATGNFLETYNDLQLAPVNNSYIGLRVARSYNSVDPTAGLFGQGWHSTYDMRLLTGDASGTIVVINPDGRQDSYPSQGGGTYKAPSRSNAVLTKGGDGYFTLVTWDKVSYRFDPNGQLVSLTDRDANGIGLTYSPTSIIVTSTQGQVLTMTLTSIANSPRVTSLTDGTRTVNYGYDPQGRLNQVQDARHFTTGYGYDANGYLNQLTDPNSHVVLQNIYDNYGRVLTQTTYPGPTTSYTIKFDYTQSGKTIFTNARGYTTTYGIDPVSALPVSQLDYYNNQRTAALDSNDNAVVITNTNARVDQSTYNFQGRATSSSTTVSVDGQLQVINTATAYNANNDPVVMTDTRGYVTRYGYDSRGNVTIITDTLGHPTSYTYDAQGRISSTSTFGGLTTAYAYNALGLPSLMTQTLGTPTLGSNGRPIVNAQNVPVSSGVNYVTAMTYTPQGWLASKTDPYDTANPPNPIPTTTYQYDEVGHVLTTTNQLNQQSYNQYDKVGNLITQTNSLGQKTYYGYDWLNRLITTTQELASGNLVSVNSYNETSKIAVKTDPRNVSTYYTYDALDRQAMITSPLQAGGVVSTSNTYDGSGNLTTVTKANQGYGGSGNQVTTYAYDELNRVVTTTTGVGVFNYGQIKIYDQAGNVILARQSKNSIAATSDWNSPSQVVTSSTVYDARNRQLSKTVLGNTSAGANKPLTTLYNYDDLNNVTTQTNPYGVQQLSQTDPAGRAVSTTVLPASSAYNSQIEHSYNFYDANGLNILSIDPASDWTVTTYEQLHRPASTTLYTASNGTGTALTTQTYYTDTVKPQITTIGPAPYYQRQDVQMDEAGRLINSTSYTGSPVTFPTLPTGSLITSFTYDGQGNKTTMTSPDGFTTQYGYENTGWLTSVVQTATTQSSVQTYNTHYTYDLVGNRTGVQDANTHTTSSFNYDVLSRLTDENDALGHGWHNLYDGLNRQTSRQDAKGQQTTFLYDNASRLLQIASPGNLTTTLSYNNGGQTLAMVDNNNGSIINTTYDYDGLNRLVSFTNPQGIIKYAYDVANRRTNLSFGSPGTPDPNLKQTTYTYDGLSRPVTLTNWLNGSATYSYSGTRQVGLSYPNGVAATYGYDGSDRLTSLSQLKGGSTNVFSATYTLDNRGNRTAITEKLNGVNRNLTYSYDELSRLVKESSQVGPASLISSTYQYDPVGNRTQMLSYVPANTKGGSNPLVLTTTYTYDQADRLATRTESGSTAPFNSYNYGYSYDNNDSLTQETNTSTSETSSYSYDSRNRLVGWQKLKTGGGATLTTASFKYDGLNARQSLTYNSTTTGYLQDGSAGLPVVLQESVSGQTAPGSFFYAPGSTTPLFQTAANGPSLWYHADGLGSVRALTNDTDGNVSGSYAYSAFGTNQSTGDSSLVGAGGKTLNDHQFAGEQLDPTGLYYNRARYYNPSIGRFSSRDDYAGNVKLPGTLNRYDYVLDNPTDWVDPSGYDHVLPGGDDGSNGKTAVCKTCECKVEIVKQGLHLGVIFTDCNGGKSSYHGGPSRNASWFRSSEALKVVADRLVVVTGPSDPDRDNSVKDNGQTEASKELLRSNDKSVCTKTKECLEREAQRINGWLIPYSNVPGKFLNSNSVARTLLHRCDLKEERPDGFNITPGWEHIITSYDGKYSPLPGGFCNPFDPDCWPRPFI